MDAILQAVGRFRAALTLGAFAIVFVALSVSSYLQKSLAIDENGQLFDGYMMLTRGCHVQTDRPPFLNMLAALPLMIEGVRFDPDHVPDDRLYHAFYFEQNDCDRLLLGPRFMITLLGVVTGVILFFWVYELYRFWPAAAGLALSAFEPNILCNAGVATQDLGITCFFFGTIYFLWRTMNRLTLGNVGGLVFFLALAHVSKYSAFLLGPLLLLLLAVRVLGTGAWPFRWKTDGELRTRSSKTAAATGVLLLGVAICVLGIWITYGFRYATRSAVYGGPTSALYADPATRTRLPGSAALIGWIDQHQLLPNAYTQNLLRQESNIGGQFAAYLMGRSKPGGWWYYFPVVFLVKTPLTLLILFFAGAALYAFQGKKPGLDSLCVLLPSVAYLAATMSGNLNIGVRHLLPLYPFVILVAVAPLAELLRRGMKWPVVCFCLLAGVELANVYPHYRGFFNCLAGGPKNGPNILADSNIDWGQDLKLLKRWMTMNQVSHVNLAYWGLSDPAYYGIDCTHLLTTTQSMPYPLSLPQLPGYVPVSVQLLHDPAFPQVAAYYSPLLEKTPVAVIGYSIYVYWVDQW